MRIIATGQSDSRIAGWLLRLLNIYIGISFTVELGVSKPVQLLHPLVSYSPLVPELTHGGRREVYKDSWVACCADLSGLILTILIAFLSYILLSKQVTGVTYLDFCDSS